MGLRHQIQSDLEDEFEVYWILETVASRIPGRLVNVAKAAIGGRTRGMYVNVENIEMARVIEQVLEIKRENEIQMRPLRLILAHKS